MNKQTIIIIILSIVIIGIVGFFAYNKITEVSYNNGANDAIIYFNQQMFLNIQQKGYVPFSYMEGNETRTINLVPYNTDDTK